MDRRALTSAFAFFCVLCACGVLRPLRGAMGVHAANLPWLISASSIAVLLIRPTALMSIAALAVFFFAWSPSIFFVWFGVFSVGIVASFWTSMTETFDAPDARRHFGFIAAGGTLGAITGPLIALLVTERRALLAIAAGLLLCGVRRPGRRFSGGHSTKSCAIRPVASSLFIACYTILSTLLYFAQVEMLRRTIPDPPSQIAWFASLDLIANLVALVFQLCGAAIFATRLAAALVAVPAIVAIGFISLAIAPVLPLLAVLQVVHRAGSFAIARPGREMLFAGDPYVGKRFIDTAIYRSGDVAGACLFSLTSMSAVAPAGAAIALLWMIAGLVLGKGADA